MVVMMTCTVGDATGMGHKETKYTVYVGCQFAPQVRMIST